MEDAAEPPAAANAAQEAERSGGRAVSASKPAGADPAGKEVYRHMPRVRAQHRRNLFALLQRSLQQCDFTTAAGAAGTLLAALPPGVEALSLSTGSAGQVVLLVHTLWSALEVMQQHRAPPEQVKRGLRRIAALLVDSPSLRQAAQLQLMVHTWKHSSPSAALDLISHEEAKGHMNSTASSSSPFARHMAWITALIRHQEWLQQVLPVYNSSRAAADAQQQRQQSYLSRNNVSNRSHLMGPLQLPLVSPVEVQRATLHQNPGGVGAVSQNPAGGGEVLEAGVEAAEEAELQLRRVVGMFPGASLPTLLLCHLLAVTSRHTDAAAVAAAAAALVWLIC